MRGRLTVALVATLLFGAFTAAPTEASTRHFSPDVRAARAYALEHVGPAQFRCLDVLWERESHWNPRSHNRYSGAHGIPQATPGVKMRSEGKDWATNPTTQVRWGLKYLRRYGSACAALAWWNAHGWY